MKAFPTARPYEVGIPAAAVKRFAEREGKNGCHGFVIVRHGRIAAQGYFAPYRAEFNHIMYSLSKSFTSTAVGFAVQEGKLSLDDRVMKFFPDTLPSDPCENMMKMRVRDLLMMATGHDREPNGRADDSDDWAAFFLRSYVAREPGKQDEKNGLFVYNSLATYMASVIVSKATGQTVYDYLKPRLLDPLGIEDTWFEQCPKGYNTGGWGYNIKATDIARMGQFLLQRGMWEGKQLLNSEWVDEATGKRIETVAPEKAGTADNWSWGYGYQFWRNKCRGSYRMDGMWGQFGVVMPEQDMVVALITGTEDTGDTLDAIWEELVPALTDGEACKDGDDTLDAWLATLTRPIPQGETRDFSASYITSDNILGVKALTLTTAKDGTGMLTLEREAGTMQIALGYGKFTDSTAPAERFDCTSSPMYGDISAAAAWQDGKCTVHMVYNKTPYADTIELTPTNGAMSAKWTRYPNIVLPKDGITVMGIEK